MNDKYYESYLESINATHLINHYSIIEYRKSDHALRNSICDSDTMVFCSMNIRGYLDNTNFMKNNSDYNLMFFTRETNNEPDDISLDFLYLLSLNAIILGITILSIMIVIVICIPCSLSNAIYFLLFDLFALIILYSFLWAYFLIVNPIVNEGFQLGEKMYGMGYNGRIITPNISCINNIDCFNKMVLLSQYPHSDGYVVIDEILPYKNSTDITPIMLPIINILIITYVIITKWMSSVELYE